MVVTETKAYQCIRQYYGEREARRSGVPLINHIDEGLQVLSWIESGDAAMEAFCIHPLVQSDEDLSRNWGSVALSEVPSKVLALAMEYRSVANANLSFREVKEISDIRLSPFGEVNQMLVADKVQNFKDFRKHHLGSHPRSEALDRYFRNWLARLDIPMDQFEVWAAKLG